MRLGEVKAMVDSGAKFSAIRAELLDPDVDEALTRLKRHSLFSEVQYGAMKSGVFTRISVDSPQEGLV